MPAFTLLLALELLLTTLLTGLIWTVQRLVYPLLREVPPDAWQQAHAGHLKRAGQLIAPLMSAELIIATVVATRWPAAQLGQSGHTFALLLLAVIWLDTFLLRVRQHQTLSSKHDPRIVRALVTGNWIRTVAWTLRLGVLVALWVTAVTPPNP